MNGTQQSSVPDKDAQIKENPSRIKQYWQRKLLYNAPMLVDLSMQPNRFAAIYYLTYCTASPFINWLKNTSHSTTADSLWLSLLNPLSKCIIYSSKTIHKYLFPSALKPYSVNPFEWTPFHYKLTYLFIASMGCVTSFLYSYSYFNKSLNDRLQWPYVYDYLMNKDFTKCVRNLLNQCPLNDNFHIDVTLKLYPIIYAQQQQYFENNNNQRLSQYFELKIVQFTAANVAWYSTKWNKVTIQSKRHRIVGTFLCDYTMDITDEQRKARKKEIRDTILKIKKTRLNELNVCNKLEWCKNMCLTLQTHFHGHWVVIAGHRAQCRSFHSVIYNMSHNNYEQQTENTQRVQFTVNNKTNAEFFHFGMGPKWFNWSVVIAKIS